MDRDPRLANVIARAARQAAPRGLVPERLIETTQNALSSVPVEGDAIFGAHALLIREAKSEILLQTYALYPDSTGVRRFVARALADLQESRVQRGEADDAVRVRILFNELRGPAALFMAKAGGRRELSAFAVLGFVPDPAHLDVEIGVHRNWTTDAIHSKTLVVDGQRAIVAGANLQECNHGDPLDPSRRPQYDYGLVLEGHVARALREGFRSVWSGAITRGREGRQRPVAPLSLAAHDATRGRIDAEGESTVASTPVVEGSARIVVLTRPPEGLSAVLTRRLRGPTPQREAFLSAIGVARARICILTPNLNEPEVLRALMHAIARGVKVQIVLSKGFNDERESRPFCGGTNVKTARTLHRATSNAENLQLRWYCPPGDRDPVEGKGDGVGASHAKLMVVDDEVTFAGSTNLDKQSWRFASETTLALLDRGSTKRVLEAVFEPVFERAASMDVSS